MSTRKVLFVHGLWIHTSSWKPWMQLFREKGYDSLNPGWPGDSQTVEGCRSNPKEIANRGVVEVADHYAQIMATLQEPPILIGHSFGGLLAQILLGRGLAAAAVAIDPAPLKGVWQLPFSALKASFPVLSNPFNLSRAVSLTFAQFRYGFANAVPEEEAKSLYEKWTIPAPARPLFQAATATFNPSAETTVNTANATRGPLLITGGSNDHIAPPVLGRASQKKYNDSVVTDFHLFDGKGHSLVVDHGWQDVASVSLQWLARQGL